MRETNEINRKEMGDNTCRGPSLSIYHPNGKGTGCALKMQLIPATENEDGYILMTMANQKTIYMREGSCVKYPTFEWDGSTDVYLDVVTLCKMLQVFRGEVESIDDGRGVYIRHDAKNESIRITLRHIVDPVLGYILEANNVSITNPADDKNVKMVLTEYEALGVMLAIENSIGKVCFGK